MDPNVKERPISSIKIEKRVWIEGVHETGVYQGEMDGSGRGKGKFTFDSGKQVYEGYFEKAKPNGKGVLTRLDLSIKESS